MSSPEPDSSASTTAPTLPPGFIPPGMVGCVDLLTALDEPLHAAETPGTERMAPVRLREFVAGRTAAHRALRQLTGRDAPVPRNADRSPSWPEGVCGSLSHSRHYAICVVARLADYLAIGVDLEEDSRLGKDLWSHVVSASEQAFLAGLPTPRAVPAATLLFSAKESYYKCLPRRLREPALLPEPDRIETSVDFDAGTFTCSVPREKSLPALTGRFAAFNHHWITLLHIAA